MRAIQIPGLKQDLQVVDIPDPVPGEGEVVVDLMAAAFNRRDYWIQQGKYPGIDFPVVPGSDGCGRCDGRDVVIDAGIGWGINEHYQQKGFHLIGMPEQGMFAERICVPKGNVYDKPRHLHWSEAAALPVAGVTAYRALFTRGEVSSGERLLITGGGGGVSVMALQLALAAGLEVFVTSGSDSKINKLTEIGAAGGENYHSRDWPDQLKKLAGGFDIILDGSGGDSFAPLVKLCKPGGRIVVYGGTTGSINDLSPQYIFWRQINILGTSMGSPRDFAEMLAFVDKYKVRPIIDSELPFNAANKGMAKLAESTQIGKIVLMITQ